MSQRKRVKAMQNKNDFSYEIDLYKRYYKHEDGFFVASFFEHVFSNYIVAIFNRYELGVKKEVEIFTPNSNKGSFKKNIERRHRVHMLLVSLSDIENLIDNLQNLLEKRIRKNSKLTDKTEMQLEWARTAYNFCIAFNASENK